MINKTLAQHTQSLADYLPNGKLWEAKNIYDSNFRQLLIGLSGELFTAQGYLIDFEQEYFPDATNLFLSEWESALMIPDDCLSVADSNEERRRDIIVKLVKMAVQTVEDFEALALMYGLVANVQPAIDVAAFPIAFPIPFFHSVADAKYTIFVDISNVGNVGFVYAFPLVFGDRTQAIVECLFNKVKPANTQIIFRAQ